jgi:flagellar protein FlaG
MAMTIYSLSKNFQEISNLDGGKPLPSESTTSSNSATKLESLGSNTVNKVSAESTTTSVSDNSVKEPLPKESVDIEELASDIEPLNQNIQRQLRFQVDSSTGGTVITVIDKQNDETIRQIPSEELLVFSKRVKDVNETIDSAIGLLFKSDA